MVSVYRILAWAVAGVCCTWNWVTKEPWYITLPVYIIGYLIFCSLVDKVVENS